MPFPPSKIQNPNIKQYRKNSTSNHKNPISPSKSQPEIKPRLLWAFDSPRKDSKRQARLRCTKFFYTLDIKLCNKEYRYLRCLKSDKVCCRHLIMKMDKPFLYTRDFPVRRHHIKLFKMLIGSKAQLDFKTKFWKRISPQITAFDYISNEIANFKQLVTASSAFSYRKVNNFSFPITPNMTDTYDALFTFLKHLHSLKMLSFNTVSHINEVEASYVLSSLNYLSHLRALNLNLRGNNSVCVETISESLPQFHALQFLSLQFGKLSTKKVQEMLLRKVAAVTGNLHSVTHLELELYIQKSYTDAFLQFLSGLENLHKLVSLDLRIDRNAASVNEALNLPEVEDSVLKNLKYLTLEGRKQGIGIELVEYFLGKTRNLEACSLTNIELSKPKTGSEEMSELILRNQGLRELRIIYEGEFDAKALEILFQGTKRLEKLQLFLLQLHNPETIAFNVESLIGGITGLQKADTVVIEVAFPIEMKLPMLNRLFDNLHKLKRLCGLKIDLRLASELKGSGVKKLFTNDSFDVFTMTVEGMKLTKEDQKFIKEHTKTMKKLTSVLLECEDFKMDRVF